MVLGLASGEVLLARAHDAWAAAYERERAKIVAVLGEHLLDIQHVGSTSIPGVPAKPILDILVGVRDFDEATACVGPMIDIGYTYRGENGIPRRHYFVKGDPRTHHVHMVEVRSDSWKVTLKFRDLLRMNPVLASEYAREKERLVLLHPGDREMYQREKDKIVQNVLAREAVDELPGGGSERALDSQITSMAKAAVNPERASSRAFGLNGLLGSAES